MRAAVVLSVVLSGSSMLTLPVVVGLGLGACGGDPTPVEDTDDTGPPPPVDADSDGFDVTTDCDDTNADIRPGAEEICDELDNNCDKIVDEGFDNDGDGYWSKAQCPFGDDCNDRDGKVNPGADDIPYNLKDEDCDGADLVDVDGDGFIGKAASGDDCDDTVATVYPGADEVPYDNIDQDCDGADLLDADRDGHDSEGHGGDDCADDDPRVNPSVMDWANDVIDSDCDGRDGARADFRMGRALYKISGTAGRQEWLGHQTLLCDFDGDDVDDLVVTSPLSSSYGGAAGVWLAQYAEDWIEEMTIDDADVRFSGSGANAFFGMMAACGDIDGDGRDDLVFGKAEINYPSGRFNQDLTFLVYYGDDDWSFTMDERKADATWTQDLITSGTPSATLYSMSLAIGDLDGDGAGEVILGYTSSWPGNARDEVWVVPGKTHAGPRSLTEVVGYKLHMDAASDDDGSGLTFAVCPDMNGDTTPDLLVGQSGYQLTVASGTGATYEGRVLMLSDVETSQSLEAAAYATLQGETDMSLGTSLYCGDVDGSGKADLLLGAGFASTFASEAGGVWWMSDPVAPFSGTDVTTLATGTVSDSNVDAWLGTSIYPVSTDVDDDGKADVLVVQRNLKRELNATDDEVHLISGGSLGADVDVDNVRMATWLAESDIAATGSAAAAGDFSGDGIFDIAIAAPRTRIGTGSANDAGRVFVYGSAHYPWGYRVGIPEE